MKFSLDRLAELFAEEFSSADMEMDQGIQEDCALWAHNAAEHEFQDEDEVREAIRSRIKSGDASVSQSGEDASTSQSGN